MCTPQHDEAVVAAQAVNFALKALQRHSECRYISITSANHAYGSEVVERVLGARPVLGQPSPRQPDILLAPMDSKYFATQGKKSFPLGVLCETLVVRAVSVCLAVILLF